MHLNKLKLGLSLLTVGYAITGFITGFLGSERLINGIAALILMPTILWVMERMDESSAYVANWFNTTHFLMVSCCPGLVFPLFWAGITGYWSAAIAWIAAWILAGFCVGFWFFMVNDTDAWNKGWSEPWVWAVIALVGALSGGASVGDWTKMGTMTGIGIALLAYIQASSLSIGYTTFDGFFKGKQGRYPQFIGFLTLIIVSILSFLFGAGIGLNFADISNI